MDIKEIKSSYNEEKKENDRIYHYWAYLIIRPVSFYVTRPFLAVGCSANQVTILGFVVLISGLLVISVFGTYGSLIAGALLVNLWYLFDFVDGNIARVNRESSSTGAYLDWFVGHIYHAVLPLAVGYYMFNSAEYYLYIGMVCSFTELSRMAIGNKRKLLFTRKPSGREELSALTRLAYGIISFKALSFLVLALIGAPEIWLIFFTFFSVVIWSKLVLQLLFMKG